MVGTIPQVAVKAFLNAPRDDHRWMKKLTAVQIDAALAALNPRPYIPPEAHIHQKACFLLGVAHPGFAFWLDMGLGKSLLALLLLNYWWECGFLNRAIIVVKSEKAFQTWVQQLKRWKIDIPSVLLGNSSSAEKWKILKSSTKGLVIVPYAGLTRMATKRGKNKKGKGVLKILPTLIDNLAEGVDGLVLDESTCCGHHDSLITRVCGRIRRRVKFCYALAGRPFGRDPELMWSQYKIIDGGETFGETLGLFKAAFYTEEENLWSSFPDYKFDVRMMKQLMRQAQHRSISYEEGECIDVPKFTSIVEEVSLPQEAGAYYKKVVQQIIAAKGNLQAMENAFIRMRQLSSGFLGFRSQDDDKRVEVAFSDNPKLECLLDLLDGIPNARKAVVFYDFTFSGRKIYESLRELGLHGIWLWGGSKNSGELQRKFQEDPDCTVAVINNKTGAYSLDGLQEVANYCMFYESPVSVLDRSQAEARLRRQGQGRRVFQYDLIVKGTMDARILEFHRAGDNLLKALRANPEALLRGL